MTASRATTLAALGLVLAVCIAYANSLGGPFVFDDRSAILENPSIRQLWPITESLSPPAGGHTVSGRPLVNLSLAINYAIGGEDPAGYHVSNIIIHSLAGLTLFGVIRRTWPGVGVPFAAAVAALWLLHPLQTAAVSYVVQRAEALMGLFFLLTLYCFIRGVYSPARKSWLAWSVAACLAGMGCKEVMVTAPVLVLLYDRTFVAGNFREAWRVRRGYYLALAGTWLLLVLVLREALGRGGTAGLNTPISSWDYLLTQAGAIARYLQLSLWPHALVFDYGELIVTRLTEVLLPGLMVVTLLVATGIALWRRPAIGFLGAWFFVILAPTSTFVPVASQTVAEHRMYLPLAAVVVAIAAAVRKLAGRHALVPLAFLCLVAGGMTMARNVTYRSEIALWADAAAKLPLNVRAHLNWGNALLYAGRFAEAAERYEHARALSPESSDIRVNLCQAYTKLGRSAEAVTEGEAAVRLDPENSNAHVNLASALVAVGRLDDAIEHYASAQRLQQAADIHHALADTLVRRAQAYAQQGRHAEAEQDLAEALRVSPHQAEVHFTRGNLAAARKEFREAIAAYRRALELEPDHIAVRNNLANALLVTGQIDQAILEYRRVLQARPEDNGVRENLEYALELQRTRQSPAR